MHLRKAGTTGRPIAPSRSFTQRLSGIRIENTPKIHFSARLGEEPEFELELA
jgi:hypothetical protein